LAANTRQTIGIARRDVFDRTARPLDRGFDGASPSASRTAGSLS